MIIGKYLIYLLLLCSITPIDARTLVTDSFMIRISNQCGETEKICNDVSFFAIRKVDDMELSLLGTTLNRKDSLEPYGYTFTEGVDTYSIFIAHAEIVIERAGRMILFEKGEWLHKEEQRGDCLAFYLPENGLAHKDHLCFYRDQSITDVYQQVKELEGNEHLIKHLEPLQNKEYQISRNSRIIYNWLSENNLHVTLNYPTYRMRFNFYQSPRGTQVYTRFISNQPKAFHFIY